MNESTQMLFSVRKELLIFFLRLIGTPLRDYTKGYRLLIVFVQYSLTS
jgi:hypothetical protein